MLLKVDGDFNRSFTLEAWEPLLEWLFTMPVLPSEWRITPVRYYAKRHHGYVTVVEVWLEWARKQS